jgi:DNA-binding beta-propeller fold protein YncE
MNWYIKLFFYSVFSLGLTGCLSKIAVSLKEKKTPTITTTTAGTGAFTTGQNAYRYIGQLDFVSSVQNYSADGLNGPVGVEFDSDSKRLFVTDFGGNRIMVYDFTNGVTNSPSAVHVLGSIDFVTTPTGSLDDKSISNPYYTSYDKLNKWLFVSDTSHCRVLVYDLSAGITDNQAAFHVLGQGDFTSVSCAAAQDKLSYPTGVSYDSVEKRLFVLDGGNARIVTYDLSSGITDGMPATNVLGQADFITGTTHLSQRGFNFSEGSIFYDVTAKRLFVSDDRNNRVVVFDLSSGVTDNMLAANVLGQPDFTTSGTYVTSSKTISTPEGLFYDSTHKQLFVSDIYVPRVAVFDLSNGITDNMDMSTVLGEPDFVTEDPLVTQNRMIQPYGLWYDVDSDYLFVGDYISHRTTVFKP